MAKSILQLDYTGNQEQTPCPVYMCHCGQVRHPKTRVKLSNARKLSTGLGKRARLETYKVANMFNYVNPVSGIF